MSQQRICDGCGSPIDDDGPQRGGYIEVERHRQYQVLGTGEPLFPGAADLHNDVCATLYFVSFLLKLGKPLPGGLKAALRAALLLSDVTIDGGDTNGTHGTHAE